MMLLPNNRILKTKWQMDFERIVVKTLFSSMSIESVAERVKHKDSKGFLNDFLAMARRENAEFTESELELLRRDFEEAWCRVNNRRLNNLPIYAKSFKVLFRITEALLCIDRKGNPIVHFDQLLRWRMFNLLVGEDLLTTAYLAKYAYEHDWRPSSFAWSDVITHDEENINRILGKGMTDVHMHYGASMAIFNLNWICMMNDISGDPLSGEFDYYQKEHISFSDSSLSYSLRTLWIAAAFLRKELFRLLYMPDSASNMNLFWRILDDDILRNQKIVDIQGDINNFAMGAFKCDGGQIDYALKMSAECNDRKSINLYECGERKLLFIFFLKYLKGEESVWANAGYFYLYLLIKNRIRQELEHTNMLTGFLNFKHYQDRKLNFIPQNSLIKQNEHNMVIWSSMYSDNDKLELRLTWDKAREKFSCLKFRKNFLAGFISNSVLENCVSLVYSFIKSKPFEDGRVRFASKRNAIKKCSLKLSRDIELKLPIKLTGIDAAGNELNCRPEVYAHAYRYMRDMGIIGCTYHVGEDFYDIVDGLRAIDEACLFLELGNHSRLGHTLALGVDPAQYYKKRRFNVVMPRQNLLDDYVWLFQKIKQWNIQASPSFMMELEDRASILFYEIGYKDFSILKYWHSWLLRGEDEPNGGLSVWEKTSHSKQKEIINAHKDLGAEYLHQQYDMDTNIRKKGAEIVEAKFPREISNVVLQLQKNMIRQLSEKGIAVETNPSSNLCIGPFSKYEDLPIFKLAPMEHDVHTPLVNVSVNTDDRGVFSTSLYNEFSLVAAALFKQRNAEGERRWSDEAIYRYIDWIRENGNHQRFSS